MKSIISFLFCFALGATAVAETIIVSLDSKQSLTGMLYVALFDSAQSFPAGEPLMGVQRQWRNTGMTVAFEDIEHGVTQLRPMLIRMEMNR